MLLSDFPVLFKADFIFKDFQVSLLNSSTFQACANPYSDNHFINSTPEKKERVRNFRTFIINHGPTHNKTSMMQYTTSTDHHI